MINDSQEDRRGREAEFQTPQQPDPVSIPPKMKPSQLLDSPSKLRALDDLPVKSSQKIDSPSAMKPRTSRGGVDEFGSKSTPSGVHDGQDLRKNHSGPSMHDPSSMHTRITNPDQYKPGPDTRQNPSGPRLKLSSERAAEREAADLKAGRGARNAGELVTRGDFERMFWMMFPEELRGLAWNRYGGGAGPTVGDSAVIGDEGYAAWGASSATMLNYSFACSIKSSSVVTVQKGTCHFGNSSFSLSAIDVSCTSTGHIYIKLEIGAGSWSVPKFTADASELVADDDTSIWTLCEVTVANGSITKIFQRHMGDIFESLV